MLPYPMALAFMSLSRDIRNLQSHTPTFISWQRFAAGPLTSWIAVRRVTAASSSETKRRSGGSAMRTSACAMAMLPSLTAGS